MTNPIHLARAVRGIFARHESDAVLDRLGRAIDFYTRNAVFARRLGGVHLARANHWAAPGFQIEKELSV